MNQPSLDTDGILDLLPIGVCTITDKLRVTSWNHQLTQWTGLSGDEIVGKSLVEVFPNLKQDKYLTRINKNRPAAYSLTASVSCLPKTGSIING